MKSQATSHDRQRADWAFDSGRGISALAGLAIRKSGLCGRPRAAGLGR